MARVLRSLALLLILIPPSFARAQTTGGGIVTVPLTIDYTALAAALKQQVFTAAGRAILWQGPGDCNYLTAEHPVLSRNGPMVQLETDGRLSLGVKVRDKCINPIVWNGIIQADTAPFVAGRMLKLRITDLNLLNAHHEKTLIAGRGFDLVKRYFIPRLETFEFDLDPVTDQLKALALAASSPDVAQRVNATLATLRVMPEIAVLDAGIRAKIELTLPAVPTAAPAAQPSVQLTSAEIAAFETQLDQWDAFLVFAIKQLGGLSNDPQFRDDLLGLLLDSRARLVDALQNPQSAGSDPVRQLFLEVWRRLGEIVRAAARRGTLGDRSLQFLEFVSAGDALFAFDQAAPALGMRISADDLRRLAKIMAPQSTADPLAFSFAEDPELQKMFGVQQPIESEGPLETDIGPSTPAPTAAPSAMASPSPSATTAPAPTATTTESPSPTPSESPTATIIPSASPTAAAPSPAPSLPAAPSPAPSPASTSSFDLLRQLFSPSSAWGAEESPAAAIEKLVPKLEALGKKLRRVVVSGDNAQQYHADMEQLLELSGMSEYASERVDSRDRTTYLRLVKAVAWQESCWRQFVRYHNRIAYLESSSHDVGLMQVNRYVWRGFYSVPRLEWDILYNSGAGMQILARLMLDIEKKHGGMSSGEPGDLARSVYAAYNGGPGAYRRWRGREPANLRAIDSAFWQKYQAVTNGQPIDILTCAAHWSGAPGH